MLFVPILTAIQNMLSEAATTKNLIKAYRMFTVPEPGTRLTPLCVLAPDMDIEPNLAGFAPTIVRNRKVSIDIHFLERAYEVQAQYVLAVTNMDTLQHNAVAVFEADPELSSTVANSTISRIQLRRYDAEYFEFVITLTVDTKLE
jgi:hypothetical protein